MTELLHGLVFGTPEWLLLIAPLAVAGLLRLRAAREALPVCLPQHDLRLPGTWRLRLLRVPALLRVVTLLLVITALARPQLTATTTPAMEPAEWMVVLDLGRAMGAIDLPLGELRAWQARHAADPPNRLALARAALLRILDETPGDRVGVVVFAREAWLLFPPTEDHDALRTIVEDIELGMIDPEGSALGNALGVGLRSLLASTSRHRAVVVLSDGMERGGNLSVAELGPLVEAEDIPIHTILVGHHGEALVPQQTPRPEVRTPHAAATFDANPELLAELAQRSHGVHRVGHTGPAIEEALRDAIGTFARQPLPPAPAADGADLRTGVIGLALLLLLLELLLRGTLLRRLP